MSKKKVLILNEHLEYGGNDKVAVRLGQSLNDELFECVYCVRGREVAPLEKGIASKGARIIHQPDDTLSHLGSYKFYRELFKSEHFDIVHSHMLFYSGFVLKAAKKESVPIRIAHSHFTHSMKKPSLINRVTGVFYRIIMRRIIQNNANVFIGCSKKTGEFLFGKRLFNKKGTVLNNPVECAEFEYSLEYRDAIRNEFSIPNNADVIGHIGHFSAVKNQLYLLDVFNEYLKLSPDAYLLLVGDGELREDIVKKAEQLKIKDRLIMAGSRSDANKFYSAMDCFVFPSLHEGFPLTLIEAQAAKLPCVISSNVTRETKYNSNIEFLPIDIKPRLWADKINELIELNREEQDNSEIYKNFDISQISSELEKIYLAS